MAQHDYVIANGSGAAVRSDLNNGLAAIVSQNSGATAPATTYAYQWWVDTATGLLKQRNSANNAWITIGQVDTANLGLIPAGAASIVNADVNANAGIVASKLSFTQSGTGAVARTIDSKLKDFVSVKDFGAVGNGVADDTAAIQAAIDATIALSPTTGYGIIYLPPGNYRITSTIYLKGPSVRLVGAGENGTTITYDNATGGTAFAGSSTATATVSKCEISKLKITGTASNGPSIGIDFSNFSYSDFRDLEVEIKRTNGVCLYGQGNNGAAPYYNRFDGITLQGNFTGQIGIQMAPGLWGTGPGASAGPNANVFSNFKRGAALAVGVDLQEGTGNLFSNMQFEAIGSTYYRFNHNRTISGASGTATSGTQVSLTDSGKSFTTNALAGCYLYITAGTGAGQSRKIAGNTATTISTALPFNAVLGATSVYQVWDVGAVSNKVFGTRGENSGSGTFATFNPGSEGNVINGIEISGVSSMFAGNEFGTTNKAFNGERVVITHVQKAVAASANIDVFPRLVNYGGLIPGYQYVLDYVAVRRSYTGTGTATVTVDAGGISTGGGVHTLIATIPAGGHESFCQEGFGTKRTMNYSETLYVNIATDSAWGGAGATDVIVSVGLRVL